MIVCKYKNMLNILVNTSSHRNQKVKDVINKDKFLLYTVPHQCPKDVFRIFSQTSPEFPYHTDEFNYGNFHQF